MAEGSNPGVRNYFLFLLRPSIRPSFKETCYILITSTSHRSWRYKNVSLDSCSEGWEFKSRRRKWFYFLVESIDHSKSKETCQFLSPEQAHGMIDIKMTAWTHVMKLEGSNPGEEMIFFLVESIDHSKSKETCHILITWTSPWHDRYKNDSLDSC